MPKLRATALNPQRPLIAGIYGAILLLGVFVLFYNLDGRLLWGDEAETAVLAKNVVKFRIPKTVDGMNHITLYGGGIDENKDNIWILSPWLQEYVAAVTFKLFGATTWTSRAPFAFIGWLSLVLIAFTAYQIYRDHWIALSSVALLCTSEIFLLHARQCRYYSISTFSQIVLIYAAYLLIVQNKKGPILLALALSLQFYSNYLIALANLPAVILLAWILYKQNKRSARWLITALGVFLLIAAPWILYAKPWQQLGVITERFGKWTKLAYYGRSFQFQFLPWAFVLLPLCALLVTRYRQAKRNHARAVKLKKSAVSPAASAQDKTRSRLELFFVWLLPLYISILVFLPGPFTRYLLPLLPVACLLGAAWIFRYIKWRIVAVAIILLQCTTNALAVVTGFFYRGQHPVRAPLIEHILGITHPYRDRFSDVLDFLKTEARPGETVYVFDPEFPLIFYTQLRVLDGRLLRGTVPSPLPDWILLESASGVTPQQPIQLPTALSPHYEQIVLSVHASRRDAGRPELFEYRTAETRVPFIIYKKRADSAR